MINESFKHIVPIDVLDKNGDCVTKSSIVFILEIALITIPSLQFDEISIFQNWFLKKKKSNFFVVNLLHVSDSSNSTEFGVPLSDF